MLSLGDLEEREMRVGAMGPGPAPPHPRKELAEIHKPRNTWGSFCTTSVGDIPQAAGHAQSKPDVSPQKAKLCLS